jgi:hypothetical protein
VMQNHIHFWKMPFGSLIAQCECGETKEYPRIPKMRGKDEPVGWHRDIPAEPQKVKEVYRPAYHLQSEIF